MATPSKVNYGGHYLIPGLAPFAVVRMSLNGYLARIGGMSIAMTGEEIAEKLNSGEWKVFS